MHLNITRYTNKINIQNVSLDNDGNIVINIREYSYNQTIDDGQIDLYIDNNLITTVNVTGNNTQITLPNTYTADNTYNITLNYRDSEKFENTTLNTNITPQKYDTNTRIYANTGHDNTVNITSTTYSSNYATINEGTIDFYLEDTLIATINVTNNTASTTYNLTNMEEKEYNITATYKATRTYRNSTNNTIINYTQNRNKAYITTNTNIKTLPASNITINATLNDYNANLLNITLPAKITIMNETKETYFNEGKLEYTYTVSGNITEDTYPVLIEINQSTYYQQANKTINLIVAKNSPYITSKSTIHATKTHTIQINATLNLNSKILEKNITGILKINNKTVYQGIFENGQFQYNLTTQNLTSNTYNITIKSKETTQYHTSHKDITLKLDNKATNIKSENILSKNGEKIIINATIYDNTTRTPVTGTSTVCIKINEVTLDNIKVQNGRLVYTYTNDYSTKNYTIHIIYGGNSIYNQSEWTGILTIESTPLQIATGSITATAYERINIKASIYADNKQATGLIQTAIKINNKTITHINTTNGNIELNYTLDNSIGGGDHNITIVAGNTRKYAENTTTILLHVNKAYKKINSNDIIAVAGKTITISADIYDKNNEVVSVRTPVNIKIGGHSICDMNVTGGHIEYTYTLPSSMKKGTYDLLVQAGETSGYLHASKNNILLIK